MRLEKSRKGPLTAKIKNKYIHSPYDPEKEAKQLIKTFTTKDEYSRNKVIIIFEPGLGYVLNELITLQGSSKLVVLFYNLESYHYCRKEGFLKKLNCYVHGSNIDLNQFIVSLLKNIDIRNILFFELPTTAIIYSDLHNFYQNSILDQLKISQGSELTRNHFALKWILNSINNYIYQDFSTQICPIKSPVILVASGPSLENHIQKIAELQMNYIIAALPSSLAILDSYDIVPDILFTTDPGYYALEHLRYLHKDTVIVSSIIASLVRTDNLICGINQQSFSESLLFNTKDLLSFPEMGTVAATALFYLKNLTKNNIYITGLDFCMKDIKMHAHPHSFTPVILKDESRLNPGYSLFYKRAASMTDSINGQYRLSRNMNTYSAWFKQQKFSNAIYRLTPAAVSLPIQVLDSLEEKPIIKNKITTIRNLKYPAYDERCRRLDNLKLKLDTQVHDFENKNRFSSFLSDFTKEVFPLLRVNDLKNNIEKNSLKYDYLYKMKHLINKMGRISNG